MGKLIVISDLFCCLCAVSSVMFDIIIHLSITVTANVSLCVCVAGISQVLTTTLCSMLMECRRTSLNQWVTSMDKSIQIFIYIRGISLVVIRAHLDSALQMFLCWREFSKSHLQSVNHNVSISLESESTLNDLSQGEAQVSQHHYCY